MKTARVPTLILASILLVAIAGAVSFSPAPALAVESFTITRLTANVGADYSPQVSGDRVVWIGDDGSDYEIFTWTPSGGVDQMTSNDSYDSSPQVSGDRIVWRSGQTQVWTWTPPLPWFPISVFKIYDSSYSNSSPRVSGDRVAWVGNDGNDLEIFTWTPTGGVLQVTENGLYEYLAEVSGDRIVWFGHDGNDLEIFSWTPTGGLVQVTANGSRDGEPQVSGDRVVWQRYKGTHQDILTWTPTGGVTLLATDGYVDGAPQVAGDRVVWTTGDEEDQEVFTWTPTGGVVQVTDNGYRDETPQVSGDRIVWRRYDGTSYEIFTWTPAEGALQVTPGGYANRHPQVSGDRIVWQAYDGNDWEVFTAVAVPVPTYTLLTSVPGGGGSITRSPNQGSYDEDTSVTLTAVPDAGYVFGGWSGDAAGDTNPLVITMDGNKTVTATFTQAPTPTYTLLTSVPGGGGSITRSPNQGSYDEDTPVTLTAVPDTGYQFTGWSGDALGDTNPLVLTIDGNKTVTASFSEAPSSPVFTDVPATHRYYAAITELASRGIISGYTDHTFGPDDAVIRQQFAKMVVGTAGYPVSMSDECPFTDVDEQLGTDPLYPSHYVAVAASHAITVGKTETSFDPWANISRYQVITMVVRGADDLSPGALVTPPQGYGTWRADSTHGVNAARAQYGGLLEGLELTTLSPYGDMPRGEVAQVLYNLIQVLGL